ncbi:MAG TPA: glycosyltransferase family 4 protein [Planctomycetota bacterium]|nr:glycosyltransferase family 4 protein [Planctomycetota bacterium]
MSPVTLESRRSGSPSSLRNARPSLLMVATVPATLEAFLVPIAKHFRSLGWRVDAIARDLTRSSACESVFHGCRDIPWSRNPLDPRNLSRAARLVREHVDEGNYDLVHVHTPVAGFVTRMAIRRRKAGDRPRVIYTAHGFHFYRGGSFLKNLLFRTLEQIAGRWTDALVVMNREDEEAAREFQIVPSGRIRFMPGIGLETARYCPGTVLPGDVAKLRRELGLASADDLFLMVAEFIPRKRHEDVLYALSRLSTRHAHLLLAGAGPLEENLRRLARTLGIQDRVHFLGFRRDIPVLLRAARALILASEHEGLPRSVMEAMCMETPVIGVRIRGIEDLLEDECGLLVEKGDRTGLAWAMGQVLDDPEGALQLARRARAKMERYDLKNILELHESLYREVLSAP